MMADDTESKARPIDWDAPIPLHEAAVIAGVAYPTLKAWLRACVFGPTTRRRTFALHGCPRPCILPRLLTTLRLSGWRVVRYTGRRAESRWPGGAMACARQAGVRMGIANERRYPPCRAARA